MRFSLFKTPKPKSFNYKPLYYNPEKENLMQRVKAAQQSTENVVSEDIEMRKVRMSDAFHQRKHHSGHLQMLQGQAKKQRIRIFAIAAFLFALFYFWLKH